MSAPAPIHEDQLRALVSMQKAAENTRALTPAAIHAVADVLEIGRGTALRIWDRNRVDIYHVAERAWRQHGMKIPLAAVCAQLRRVVPDGLVMVYQDVEGRTRDDIADVFAQAKTALLAGCTLEVTSTPIVGAAQ